ncbi:hypothetical protein [Streptosporangium sp. NPDC002721]|uniref:hypothetical protein n=1 Tax=Streptosporangium sp. NPDC002721 TaxID=3366188 RepID=UPI00369D89B3
MTTTLFSTHFKAIVFASATFTLTACGAPHWENIYFTTLSADELTLTANVIFGEPAADGTHCERVTRAEVSESSFKVIIRVQVSESACPHLWPWESVTTHSIGYLHPVRFQLKKPLAGRTVVDGTRHKKIGGKRSTDASWQPPGSRGTSRLPVFSQSS